MNAFKKVIYTLSAVLLVVGGYFTYSRIRDWRNDSIKLHTQNDPVVQNAAAVIAAWDAKYKPILEKLTSTIKLNNEEIISLQDQISKIKLLTPAQIADLKSLECEKRYSVVVDQFTFCTDKVNKQEKIIDLFKGNEIAFTLKIKTLEKADAEHKKEYSDLNSEYIKCVAIRNDLQEKINRKLILYTGLGGSLTINESLKTKIYPAVQIGIGWILWRF